MAHSSELRELLAIGADDEFKILLENALLSAAVTWAKKYPKGLRAKDLVHRFLNASNDFGKGGRASKSPAESRRRYLRGEITIARGLLHQYVSIIRPFVDVATIDKLFEEHKKYRLVMDQFDGRVSGRARGPFKMGDKAFQEAFDSALQSTGVSKIELLDIVAFNEFIRKAVETPRVLGQGFKAIWHARGICSFLFEEQQGHYGSKTADEWCAFAGIAIRLGFYAAYRNDDDYNMIEFLRLGELATRSGQDRYLSTFFNVMHYHYQNSQRDLDDATWQNGFAERAWSAAHSNIPTSTNFAVVDDTLRFNVAAELARRGARLDFKPDFFNGHTIEEMLVESSGPGSCSVLSPQEIAMRQMNLANSYRQAGRLDDSKSQAMEALVSLSAVNGNLDMLYAVGRLHQVLGKIEYAKAQGERPDGPRTLKARDHWSKAVDIFVNVGAYKKAKEQIRQLHMMQSP